MEYSTVMKLQEVSRYKPSTYILTEKEKNSPFVVENWYQNMKNHVTIRVNNHRPPAAVADIAA